MSAIVLYLARVWSADAVSLLLPAMRAEMMAIDDNLAIRDLELVRDGSGSGVRLRANLVRPLNFRGEDYHPLGWPSPSHGWYQVRVNAASTLQPTIILLIMVLSWPRTCAREAGLRAALALPFAVILFALDKPLELLGNFQQASIGAAASHGTRALYAWSTFLDGGGDSVLALAFAAAAITIALAIASPSTGTPRVEAS